MKINYRKNSLLAASALALLVNHASAATFTWDGSDGAGWNTAGNWVGGAAPASANTTDIIISGTVNVAQMFSGGAAVISYTIKSLTFDATNDADSTFLMQGTTNPNQIARNLTFASNSGNATLTVESGSTGNKTITRNTGGTGTAATIILTSSLDVIHNGSGTLTLGNAVNASVTGGGGINKSGTGTLVLLGANTYTGTTTIKNGTLALDGAANRLAVAGAVVLGDTGTTGKLVLGGTTTASQTLTALTTTGSGGSVVGGNAALSALTLNIASSNTFAGTLGGAGTNENNLALTKQGVGTLTLSNTANTFTGQVLVDDGTIQVTKLENTGTASSTGAGAASIRLGNAATATLEYIGTTDSSTNRQIQVGNNAANTSGATILNNSTSGKLTFTNANFSAQATAAATQARVLTLGGSYTGAANEIQGVIKDNTAAAVSLTKTGASTWQLSGANTYTGTTTVNGGTLILNNAGGNTLADTGAVVMGDFAGATLHLNHNETIGSLAGGGITGGEVALNNRHLTVGDASSTTYAGVITGNGTAKLIKQGAGALTLTGNSSGFTGDVDVTVGTLVVNGNISTSHLTTVSANATIGGSGTVGALTILANGIIDPGNSPDVLDVIGAYTQAGTYSAEITGNTVGNGTTGYDQINVTGTVDITGGSLTALFSGTGYAANDLLFILLNDDVDAITGTYSAYAQDAVVTNYGGFDWKISYFANGDSPGSPSFTGGNDIALIAVIPEPNVAALLGGLGTLVLLRRRR